MEPVAPLILTDGEGVLNDAALTRVERKPPVRVLEEEPHLFERVTIVLGASYVGLVLAGQALFSSFAGGSNLAIAASTLVVAALFLPVRSRVQRFVDRRFYRRRYDAERTLESFGARLREQIELVTLEHDLRTVITETMQPAHASVWLRESPR